MLVRRCAGRKADGSACRAAPRRDARYCFLHDPASAEQSADAQRLGGQRRRREVTIAAAYDLPGVRSIDDLLRLVEIAVLDVLGLENSIARARLLLTAATTGAKLLETADLEARVATLEAAAGGGRARESAA